MARTAPTTYAGISDAAVLATQPILAATHDSILLNCNHIYRYTLPLVVNQDTISYVSGQYCSTNDHAGAVTAFENVLCYVCPVPGANTGQTLACAIWAAAPVGGGFIQVSTLSGAASATATVAGATYTRYVVSGIAVAPGTETIMVAMLANLGGDEIRMSHFSAWLEPGATPLPAGPDSDGWFPQDTTTTPADECLPTHRMQRLAANAAIVAARGGHCMAWSADIRQGRSQIQTAAAVRATPTVPVSYGPLSTKLRVYANAMCDNAAGLVRTWTQDTASADGLELATLPTVAAWGAAKTTSWVNGTVSLTASSTGGAVTLWSQLEGQAAQAATLWGLCIWEEA